MHLSEALGTDGLRDLLVADLAVEHDLVPPHVAAEIVLSNLTRQEGQPSLVVERLSTVADLRAEQVLKLGFEADRQIREANDSAGLAIAERLGIDAGLHDSLRQGNPAALVLPSGGAPGIRNPVRDMHRDRYYDFQLRAGGGRGLIYFASDREVGRTVAMKVLRPEGESEDLHDPLRLSIPKGKKARERFRRAHDALLLEARRVARMVHPAIIPIFEIGHLPNGLPYYTMPAGSGVTLRDAQVEGRIGFEDAARVVLRIAEAVGYAYRTQDLVHCDINPGNVMLGEHGEAFLLDWGEARRKGNWASPDGIAAAGTTGWIAPELRTDPCRIAPTIDVLGLGLMLYEVLTGSMPVPGRGLHPFLNAPDRYQSLTSKTLVPEAGEQLSRLCMECLITTPLLRPRDADEFAERLREALTFWPVSLERDLPR